MLQVNGAVFFANLNASGRQSAAARNVVQVSAASLGRFSANLNVTRLFVIPINVNPGGLGADVGLVTSGVYSRVGDAQAERDAFVTWGTVGSGFEHMTHKLLTAATVRPPCGCSARPTVRNPNLRHRPGQPGSEPGAVEH